MRVRHQIATDYIEAEGSADFLEWATQTFTDLRARYYARVQQAQAQHQDAAMTARADVLTRRLYRVAPERLARRYQ